MALTFEPTLTRYWIEIRNPDDFRAVLDAEERGLRPTLAAKLNDLSGILRVDYGTSDLSLSIDADEDVPEFKQEISDLIEGHIAMCKNVHPDDLAVDRFAAAMKAKLATKRAEGRGGWEDKTACSQSYLSHLLVEHIPKGDPIDIANFAMMLHQRGETIADERERYAESVRQRRASGEFTQDSTS